MRISDWSSDVCSSDLEERSKPRAIGADDLVEEPHAVGSIELPMPYNPNHRAFQHQVGEALRRARVARASREVPEVDDEPASEIAADPSLAADVHPVADCTHRDAHAGNDGHAEDRTS